MFMPLFIIVAIVIIVAFGAAEWEAYRQRAGAGPAQAHHARRRLRRRWLGLALLLAELFQLVFYEAFHARAGSPWHSLAYLGVSAVMALILFWVVIADVRASLAEIIKTQGDISDLHAARLEEEVKKILEEQVHGANGGGGGESSGVRPPRQP